MNITPGAWLSSGRDVAIPVWLQHTRALRPVVNDEESLSNDGKMSDEVIMQQDVRSSSMPFVSYVLLRGHYSSLRIPGSTCSITT